MGKLVTIPNVITLVRGFLLIPVLYYLFQGDVMVASVLVAVNVFMDFLDGYLARTLKQESELGKKLDPIVDGMFSITLLLSVFVLDYISLIIVLVILLAKLVSFTAGTMHVRKGKPKLPVHQYFHRPVAGLIFFTLIVALIYGETIYVLVNAVLYLLVSLVYLYYAWKL